MRLFRRGSAEGDEVWVVVGLGNPGERYARTRHNVGAMVVHELLNARGVALRSHKSGCLVAEIALSGDRTVLARPMSYMNESGRPVGQLVRWYKGSVDRLVVVHDELDIPFGQVRVKTGGGTAGHNGLRSVVSHLGTNDFIRVRVGISRPRDALDAADYVLQDFSSGERKELPQVLASGADAVERVIEVGAARAMNEVNTRE